MIFHRLSGNQRKHLWRIKQNGAPGVALELIALCFLAGTCGQNCLAGQYPYDSAEFFAGDMAITRNLAWAGYRAVSFELKHDAVCEDILSRTGFVYALSLVLSIEHGGMVWSTVGNYRKNVLGPRTGSCSMTCPRPQMIICLQQL